MFVVAMGATGIVSAQESDVERTALARELFREGVALSDTGDWEAAADRFRRSLSLRDSSVVAFNLGTACAHTGRLVEALELFRRASRDSDAPAPLREAAAAQAAALEPRIARLTLEVTGPLETVSIELDGRDVPPAMLGVAAPADPGHHVVRALRNDEEVARAEVELAEGSAHRLELAIPPLSAVADVVAPTPERPPRSSEQPLATRAPAADDTALLAGVIAGSALAIGLVVLTAVLVVDAQGPAPPIEGNLGPPVIVFD